MAPDRNRCAEDPSWGTAVDASRNAKGKLLCFLTVTDKGLISASSMSEPRENFVRLGNSTSRKRIRARYQRPCDPILPGIFVLLHRFVFVSATPILLTGTNPIITPDSDPELFDPAHLPPNALNAVEADSFWCLSRLLDGIQDNYIHGQPGIHRGVKRIAELVARIDG